jgi:hypothetical protein
VETFHDKPLVRLIHLGDHWDMPSLSTYDKKGSQTMEGKRYKADVAAGNDAWKILNAPLEQFNYGRRRRGQDEWLPEKVLLRGNHEDRITRAAEQDAQLAGLITLDDLKSPGWQVADFLEPVLIDGLVYAHYFINPANGRPVAGMIETRIKSIGASFVAGHQQGLRSGMLETVVGRRRGLIAGSCYLHDEDYRGPQGRGEWRGILVLREVHDGDYSLMEVSLEYLCRRYEGVTLDEFLRG